MTPDGSFPGIRAQLFKAWIKKCILKEKSLTVDSNIYTLYNQFADNIIILPLKQAEKGQQSQLIAHTTSCN